MKALLKNRRLIILLSAIVFIGTAGGGAYLYRKHRVHAQFMTWRAQGMAAAQAGTPRLACDLLSQYLVRYSNDLPALREYVRCRADAPLPDNAHTGERIRVLRHILRLSPDLLDERRTLMTLYLQNGYFAEAKDAAEQVLGAAPNDVDAREVKTRTLMRFQKHAEALLESTEWCKLAPDSLDSQLVHVILLKQNSKPANEIVDYVKALLSKHPDDPRFELVAGVGYALTDETTFANDDATAKQLLRSAASREMPDLETGRALLERLDWLYLAEEGTKLLERLVRTHPDPSLKLELAQRYWHANRLADVVDLLSSDPTAGDTPRLSIALRALALCQLQRAPEARPLVDALRERSADPAAQAWVVIINQLADSFDARAVLAACDAVTKPGVDTAYLRHFRAEALVRLGEGDLAVREWKELAAQKPSWPVPLIRLANVLTDMGRVEEALQAGRAAYQRDKDNSAAIMAVARPWAAQIQKGKLQGADELLKNLADMHGQLPQDGAILLLYAAVLEQEGLTQEVAALIRTAVEDPERQDEQTLLRLAALSQRLSLGLEQDCFTRCERDFGETANLAYARAIAQFAAEQPDKGLELFDATLSRASDGQSIPWQLNRARYLDLISHAGAHDAFAKLAAANPSELRVQQAVLEAKCVQNDAELLRQTIERFRNLTGERALGWRIARARWLVVHGNAEADLKEAIALMEGVILQAPDSLAARLICAKAYDKSNRLEDTVRELSAAADMSPDPAPIRLELSRILQHAGDFDRAAAQLDLVSPAQLAGPEARVKAASLLAQQGDSRRAIQLLEEDQKSLAAMNTAALAQLYARQNELKKAEELFRQTLAQQPTIGAVFAAAEFFARTGRLDEAKQVLETDVPEAKPGERELLRAQFALRFGDREEAIELFRKATHVAPQEAGAWSALIAAHVMLGHAADAKSTLAEAVAAIGNAPGGAELAAAHREATILDAADKPELRPLLLQFLANPTASAAVAEVLRIAVTSTEGDEQLVAKVRPIAANNPRALALQMFLAQKLVGMERFDEAQIIASLAARHYPAAPEPKQLAVACLMQLERWSEALPMARQWRDQAAGAGVIDADLAIARCELQLGRPAAAVQQLDGYMKEGGDSESDAYKRVVATYAEGQKAMGNTNSTRLMEPLLRQGPLGRQKWLTYAVTNLPVAEAQAWIGRAQEAAQADASNQRPEHADGEQVVLAEAWYKLFVKSKDAAHSHNAEALLTALTERPKPFPLALYARANRAQNAGDVKGAVALYRRALEAQPGWPIAQNNLAVLLADDPSTLGEAESLVEAAIKAWPNVAPLHDTLSTVLTKGGKLDLAAESLRRAVQLQPQNLEYRLRLVQVLLDGAQKEKAGAAYRELTTMIPTESPRLTVQFRGRLDALGKRIASEVGA